MKTTRKLTALLLVALMILSAGAVSAAEYKQRFWDVPKTHWAFEYIADLTNRGVISGYQDGSFKPEATVSRAEWAKMMCVAGNLYVYDNNVYFRDTKNHWANAYINAAKNYITTYADSSFRPDQAIVREDVTRALVTLKGYDTSDVDYSHIADFKDFDSISNQMKAYVAVAVERGLISGFDDNTFRGQTTLTRAEAATLLYRAFQKGDASKGTEVPEEVYKEPVAEEIPEENNAGKIEDPEENTSESNSSEDYTEDKLNNSENNTLNEDTAPESEGSRIRFHVIDELVVTARDELSTDGDSILYYIKDNDVYAHNVKTLKTKKVLNDEEMDIDTDSAYKTDWETWSVCYDPSTEGFVILGKYQTVNSASDKAALYIYSVVDNEVEALFCGAEIPENLHFISAILPNGDFVDADVVWDRDTLEYKYNYVNYVKNESGLALWGTAIDVAPDGKELNFVGIYERDADTSWAQRAVFVSNYANKITTNLWELEPGAYGISDKYVVFASNGVVEVYNLLGKKITEIELPEGVDYIATRIVVIDNFIVINDGEAGELIQIEI